MDTCTTKTFLKPVENSGDTSLTTWKKRQETGHNLRDQQNISGLFDDKTGSGQGMAADDKRRQGTQSALIRQAISKWVFL